MRLILGVCNIFLPILCHLLDALAADRFCKTFFRISKQKETVFLVLFSGFPILLSIVNRHWDMPGIDTVLAGQIFWGSLVLVLFRADVYKKILAAAFLITARELVWNFTDSLLSCAVLVFLRTAGHGRGSVIGEPGIKIIVWIAYAVGAAVIFKAPKYLESVFDKDIRKWYLILAAPLFLMALVIDIMNLGASRGILFRGGENWDIYYNQIFSHAAICAITFLSMCALGFYILGMDRIEVEQRRKEQYFSQIKFYQMLEEQYRQMERLRHDLKNHIIAMQGLAEEKDWEKMNAYLSDMARAGKMSKSEDVTGNRAIDALLFQKREAAKQKNIQWNCEMRFPKDSLIREFDLCVLLGNILDNAIEACGRISEEQERFVDIQSQIIKKCFLLEVKNSTDGKDLHGRKSRKENPASHGIGMLNIRDMVKRYDGVIDVESKDGIFTVSVLLPFRE